ncbi:MAG: hypothetical protein ACFE8J_09090 [Candidatus Heimdallarchaeota archaeon]
MKSLKKNGFSNVKCAICNSDIKTLSDIYQNAKTKGIICDSCKEKFAGENFELIIYLLFVYGGYFGMRKREEFSLSSVLEELDFNISGESIDVEDINRKLIHRALLHGYTPKEYRKCLRSILNDPS